MSRIKVFENANGFYILPAIKITWERGYHLSLDLMWFNMGLEIYLLNK